VVHGFEVRCHSPNHNAPKRIIEFARAAEESGFDHFLLSDHYWFAEEPDFLDSWTMLAYLAGETAFARSLRRERRDRITFHPEQAKVVKLQR
jgi:hypothetical protein